MRARETDAGLCASLFPAGESLEQAREGAEARPRRVSSRSQPPTCSPRLAPRHPRDKFLLPLGEALHQQPHDERQVLPFVVGGQKHRILVLSGGAALRRPLRRSKAATRPRGSHDGSARGAGSGLTSSDAERTKSRRVRATWLAYVSMWFPGNTQIPGLLPVDCEGFPRQHSSASLSSSRKRFSFPVSKRWATGSGSHVPDISGRGCHGRPGGRSSFAG